ncbi:MAG: hypothetical protein ACLFTH_01340 [Candidatus Woesearchaeota archaeon]
MFSFDRIGYDLDGMPYGSDSYMDRTVTNPDVKLQVCHENLTVGCGIDLAYISENKTVSSSLLNFRPEVTHVNTTTFANGSYNCTSVDVDLASTRALYPGIITPVIIQNYTHNERTNPLTHKTVEILNPLNTTLNGSFLVDIRIDGPPKTYHVFVDRIYDEQDQSITPSAKALVLSLMSPDNISLDEGVVEPKERLAYDGPISGGENVVVNGLPTLDINMYDPCTPINESGYYIMNDTIGNSTAQNLNDTCLRLTNISNVVVNFGEEFISGNGNVTNGSMRNNTCAVIVENSENIRFVDYKAYGFYNGLCIINSTVNVTGTQISHNTNGALLNLSSEVDFLDMLFTNEKEEIVASTGTNFTLSTVGFRPLEYPDRPSTYLDSQARNVRVKSVKPPLPPPPNITLPDGREIRGMEQHINYKNTSVNDSLARMTFQYQAYLDARKSQRVVADNISIYKYEGEKQTSFDNDTGTTTSNWTDADWIEIPTEFNKSRGKIVSSTITDFSVFAPFGFFEPEEDSEGGTDGGGDSDSSGEDGSAGGPGGSFPEEKPSGPFELVPLYPAPPRFELVIPDNITIMQGEARETPFRLTNLQDDDFQDVKIGPEAPAGWKATNHTVSLLKTNSSSQGTFSIAPYTKELPGRYLVPIKIHIKTANGYRAVFSKLMSVYVIPRHDFKQLEVLEAPEKISMRPLSRLDVDFKLQNIGDADLEDITLEFEPHDCLRRINGRHDLKAGALQNLSYTLHAGARGECNLNFKFYSQDKYVGFTTLPVRIHPDGLGETYISLAEVLLVLALLLWTALTALTIKRVKARKHCQKNNKNKGVNIGNGDS